MPAAAPSSLIVVEPMILLLLNGFVEFCRAIKSPDYQPGEKKWPQIGALCGVLEGSPTAAGIGCCLLWEMGYEPKFLVCSWMAWDV